LDQFFQDIKEYIRIILDKIKLELTRLSKKHYGNYTQNDLLTKTKEETKDKKSEYLLVLSHSHSSERPSEGVGPE
jgi:hypothetical protein